MISCTFSMILDKGMAFLQIVGLSDSGRGRYRNEDSFLACSSENLALLAVADGMGGHIAGDVASKLAISVLERGWNKISRENLVTAHQLFEIIKKMIGEANQAILSQSAADQSKQGMGTTLTAGMISGRNLVIGHVGDSRAYLIENEKITMLTEDHSLLEQMIQKGSLSPEDAQGHPQRHILTRALGTNSAEIDLVEAVLEEGAILMLCTDGLTSLVQDGEILDIILARQDDPASAAGYLVKLANERGGYDNITVVLAAFSGRQADRW